MCRQNEVDVKTAFGKIPYRLFVSQLTKFDLDCQSPLEGVDQYL